jgi:lipid-binding SYLF domain-containing protein
MIPAFTCSSSPFRFGLFAVVVVCLLSGPARAQKIDKAKFDTAARRATNAAKVLTDMSALPAGETIPKELIERARAIAVFPEVDKVNMLVEKFMKGYGVMSKRVTSGWSTPAFYGFGVADRGWTKVKSDKPGVIVLFMDDGILKGFEKDHIPLVGEAGPVGELTPEKEKKIRGASVIIYALSGGKLRGVDVKDDSTTTLSGITADNHINEAVYGFKPRDVLSGKTPMRPPVPPAVTEFQNMLTNLSKQ